MVVMHSELLKDFEGGSCSSCPKSHMQEMRKVIKQGCENLGCQVPLSAKFCVAVLYICGSAV